MSQFGKNSKTLSPYIIEREHNFDAFSDFYCGIKEMDDFLHSAFADYIVHPDLRTYKVTRDGELIAMFALTNDQLTLEDDDIDEMKAGIMPKPSIALRDSNFLGQKTYKATEIAYLAVSRNMRGHGIGKYLIDRIQEYTIKNAPDIQFITVDALTLANYTAVPFYHKCNFNEAELPHGGQTLRMYKVIHPVNILIEQQDEEEDF